MKNLDEKDITIEEKEKIIKEWRQKYKTLEESIDKSSDDDTLIAKAKEKLSAGDLDGAEKLLEQSFEKYSKQTAEASKKAAKSAYELGLIKELKLEYEKANAFFEKAVEYDPENGLYLNQLGIIFYTLGKYEKAIEYYEKALAIAEKFLGKDHPKTKITAESLQKAISKKKRF